MTINLSNVYQKHAEHSFPVGPQTKPLASQPQWVITGSRCFFAIWQAGYISGTQTSRAAFKDPGCTHGLLCTLRALQMGRVERERERVEREGFRKRAAAALHRCWLICSAPFLTLTEGQQVDGTCQVRQRTWLLFGSRHLCPSVCLSFSLSTDSTLVTVTTLSNL